MLVFKKIFKSLQSGGQKSKEIDALHYFVTSTPIASKKKVLKIVTEQVNADQRRIIEEARRLSNVKI